MDAFQDKKIKTREDLSAASQDLFKDLLSLKGERSLGTQEAFQVVSERRANNTLHEYLSKEIKGLSLSPRQIGILCDRIKLISENYFEYLAENLDSPSDYGPSMEIRVLHPHEKVSIQYQGTMQRCLVIKPDYQLMLKEYITQVKDRSSGSIFSADGAANLTEYFLGLQEQKYFYHSGAQSEISISEFKTNPELRTPTYPALSESEESKKLFRDFISSREMPSPFSRFEREVEKERQKQRRFEGLAFELESSFEESFRQSTQTEIDTLLHYTNYYQRAKGEYTLGYQSVEREMALRFTLSTLEFEINVIDATPAQVIRDVITTAKRYRDYWSKKDTTKENPWRADMYTYIAKALLENKAYMISEIAKLLK